MLNIGRVMRMRRINHGMTRDVYQCVDEPEWAAKEELWCPRPEDEGRLRQLGWRPAWQSNELELRALRRGPEARYSIPCEGMEHFGSVVNTEGVEVPVRWMRVRFLERCGLHHHLLDRAEARD